MVKVVIDTPGLMSTTTCSFSICCPCPFLYFFNLFVFLHCLALIEHFPWFFFFSSLISIICIFKNFFSACPWIFSIHLQLIHGLCQVALYCFAVVQVPHNTLFPIPPSLYLVTLMSFILIAHNYNHKYIINKMSCVIW